MSKLQLRLSLGFEDENPLIMKKEVRRWKMRRREDTASFLCYVNRFTTTGQREMSFGNSELFASQDG